MTSPKRGRGRPATGTNPVRSMRIGPVFDEARRYAEAAGETITALVERLLAAYVAEQQARPSNDQQRDP